MAQKKRQQKRTNGAVPKGFKRHTRELGRFWSPDKDDVKANQFGGDTVQGVVEGMREVTETYRGEPRTRHFVDVRTAEDGLITVDCRGDLWWQIDDMNLGKGEEIWIHYLGKDDPTPRLPQGIHRYEIARREG